MYRKTLQVVKNHTKKTDDKIALAYNILSYENVPIQEWEPRVIKTDYNGVTFLATIKTSPGDNHVFFVNVLTRNPHKPLIRYSYNGKTYVDLGQMLSDNNLGC